MRRPDRYYMQHMLRKKMYTSLKIDAPKGRKRITAAAAMRYKERRPTCSPIPIHYVRAAVEYMSIDGIFRVCMR
jgi:hypothetical protein